MRTIRVLYFVFCILLFNWNIAAQYISGKIINASNNQPLAFANCVINAKNLGTYSDLDGNFSFNLDKININDTLIVMYIGYELNKTPLNELVRNKKMVIKLMPKDIILSEVKVSPKPDNIKHFMKQWLKSYRKNTVTSPHIAFAYYREKAKFLSNYIMFTESYGYAIFLGTLKHTSPLSNYKFYYINTRKSIPKPQWSTYTRLHSDIYPNIPPGGSLGLNCFRRIELKGLLSKKGKKYHYKLDSIFYLNNREVYSIHFLSKKEEGNIEIYHDNLQLKEIRCLTDKIPSHADGGLVKGNVILRFNYFNNKAYISSIEMYYKKDNLEYWNILSIIMQKLNKFDYDEQDYWAINETDINPYVSYSKQEWRKFKMKQDSEFAKIRQEMKSDSLSLEQQFVINSGKYYTNRNTAAWSKKSDKFITKLEKLF